MHLEKKCDFNSYPVCDDYCSERRHNLVTLMVPERLCACFIIVGFLKVYFENKHQQTTDTDATLPTLQIVQRTCECIEHCFSLPSQ